MLISFRLHCAQANPHRNNRPAQLSVLRATVDVKLGMSNFAATVANSTLTTKDDLPLDSARNAPRQGSASIDSLYQVNLGEYYR